MKKIDQTYYTISYLVKNYELPRSHVLKFFHNNSILLKRLDTGLRVIPEKDLQKLLDFCLKVEEDKKLNAQIILN